jgi:hypothetical protein
MSQIRQRYAAVSNNTFSSSATTPSGQNATKKTDALAASNLLKSNPTNCGQVLKLDVPLFYSLMPTWVQRILRYFPSPFRPSWKRRYMIQIGKYLYRYQIDTNTGIREVSERSKMKLKGTPILLSTVHTTPLVQTTYGLQSANQEEVIANASDLPPFCSGFFSITSDGETRHYAVSTVEEANTWFNSLSKGRQSNIELTMGHDKRTYPETWRYIDTMGEERVRRNKRVKDLIRTTDRREIDIMEYCNGGISGNRGHFG